MQPRIPQKGLELLKSFEKCRLDAYPDPKTRAKPYTIGWGSTKKLDGSEWALGDTLTQKEADDLLISQVSNKYLATLARTIPYWQEMNENQQGALLCFSYNLGANFYGSEGFDTITKMLKIKNWIAIPSILLLYRDPGSVVEEGLRLRRLAEGKLWSTPC